MRKSSKLLAVLLTLCLLFGAITAIFASASETTLPVGNLSKDDDTKKLTGNTNRTHLQTYEADKDLTKLQYVTFDAEINFVDGDVAAKSKNLRFDPSIKISSLSKEQTPFPVYVVEKDNSVYLSFTNNDAAPNENAKVSNKAGEFTHFAFVIAIDNSTSGKVVLTPSFYVNGKFIAEGTAWSSEYSAGDQVYLYRFATKAAGTGTTAKANFGGMTYNQQNGKFNYYTTGSDNAKALTTTLVGMGMPSSSVQIGEKIHTNIADAKAALATITAGTVVTVDGMNLIDVVVPEGLSSFTVICKNDGAFSLSDSCKYLELKDDTQTTYSAITDDNYYVTVNGGEKIHDPEVAAAALKTITDGAEIVIAGMNLSDIEIPDNAKNFTVTTDEIGKFNIASDRAWRYVEIDDKYTKVIDGQVQANLELYSERMWFKLYFPAPEVGTLTYEKSWTNATDTVVADKNANLNGNIKKGGTQMVDTNEDGIKEKYIVVFWQCRTDMLTTTAYPEFSYTNADGESATLLARHAANFNVVTYAKEVVNSKNCGSEESRLVRALMDYNVEFMKAAGKSVTDADSFYAIFDNHENCTCGNIDTPLAAEGDYINLGKKQDKLAIPEGVELAFGMNSEKRLFNFYVTSAIENGSLVSISYTNVYNELTVVEAALSDAGRATFAGISACDIDNALSITVYNVTYETVKDEAGNDVKKEVSRVAVCETFTFSLADYDVENAGDLANLLKAFKNYAIAAENYKKYVPATTTTPEA